MCVSEAMGSDINGVAKTLSDAPLDVQRGFLLRCSLLPLTEPTKRRMLVGFSWDWVSTSHVGKAS